MTLSCDPNFPRVQFEARDSYTFLEEGNLELSMVRDVVIDAPRGRFPGAAGARQKARRREQAYNAAMKWLVQRLLAEMPRAIASYRHGKKARLCIALQDFFLFWLLDLESLDRYVRQVEARIPHQVNDLAATIELPATGKAIRLTLTGADRQTAAALDAALRIASEIAASLTQPGPCQGCTSKLWPRRSRRLRETVLAQRFCPRCEEAHARAGHAANKRKYNQVKKQSPPETLATKPIEAHRP